ncbi:MAG: Ig-like domain-containing protein, partial [bacterium]
DPADEDGDGVYYADDLCPGDDASFFDWNGDGCRDLFCGGRHVEYWDSLATVTYYIELDAAPTITDGSDFTAIQTAMNTWPLLAGSQLNVAFGGTTDNTEALPLDGINLVTFKDPVMNKDTGALFGSTVLAVGIATSFTEPTFHDGKFYRPGEIVDADMLFNPAKDFKTDTAGSGKDLQSIAVHEAGHLFGLSHSAVHSSTMFAVLLGGAAARTPETEDSLLFIKSYPNEVTAATMNGIRGVVTDGLTGDPVPNAAVFAINSATGDTVAQDVTTDYGRYTFAALDNGSYYVSIHPLDGSADAGYLKPSAVNFLSESWGETDFIPEYYNDGDSPVEDPNTQSVLPLAGAWIDADILTNVDIVPPEIVSVSPDSNSVDVLVNTAVVIGFSEEIDYTTVQGNFRLENKGTGTAVGGTGTVYQDGLVLSFVPWGALEYATTYRCSLATGIKDKFGNGLAAPVAFDFSTEAEPPLHVDALIPDRGVPVRSS